MMVGANHIAQCGRSLVTHNLPVCLNLVADLVVAFLDKFNLQEIGETFLKKAISLPLDSYEKALSAYVWKSCRGKEHLLHFFYNNLPLPPLNVLLMTDVLSDGSGDYVSVLNGAKALKNKLPLGSTTKVFVHHQKPLPSIELANFNLLNQDICQILNSSPEFGQFQEAIRNQNGPFSDWIENCKKADIAIALPTRVLLGVTLGTKGKYQSALTCFNDFFRLAPCLLVQEYSNIDARPIVTSLEYHLRVSMGLGIQNSYWELEHGIFLPEVFENPCKNQLVESLLQPPNIAFFCYQREESWRFWVYVIKNYGNDLSEIKIITKIPDNLEEIIKYLKVKQIRLISFEEERVINVEKSGPILILYNIFPLSESDFTQALSRSRPVVGCTGDSSFSLVLALGKIPFYEDLWHKKDSWANLGKLASAWGIQAVVDFVENQSDTLISNELQLGFHILHTIINRYHCIDHHFMGLIQRTFFLACFPHWSQIETHLMALLPQNEELVRSCLQLENDRIIDAFNRRNKVLQIIPSLNQGFIPRFVFHYLLEDNDRISDVFNRKNLVLQAIPSLDQGFIPSLIFHYLLE